MHSFADEGGRKSINTSTATASSIRKVISIEESLPRQRLDLFPHLDFSNELELDAESLLSILAKELFRVASELPVMADGDNSLWNLPI
jgi:hypothetical protein